MKRILKRLTEMLLACFVISICIHLLDTIGVIAKTQVGYFVSLLLGVVLYIAFIVRCLRHYYFRSHGSKNYYWKCYAAYGIFVLIWQFVYVIFADIYVLDRSVYSWLFCITRVMEYTNLGCTKLSSALIFHCVMLAVIALAPIKINWNFLTKNPPVDKYKAL